MVHPNLTKNKFSYYLIVGLLLLLGFSVVNLTRTLVTSSHQTSPQTETSQPVVKPITVQALLAEVNLKRQEAALAPLALSDGLKSSSEEKASELYQEWPSEPDNTPHISNYGIHGVDIILKLNPQCTYRGENLLWYQPDAKSGVEWWMKSPTHKSLILNPNYSEVNFAINHQYIVMHVCGN